MKSYKLGEGAKYIDGKGIVLEVLSGKKKKRQGYRQLEIGERINVGVDKYESRYDGKLYDANCGAFPVGVENASSARYYRPITK